MRSQVQNKKVNYRKQIARQLSRHQNFGQGWGRGQPCKKYSPYNLITVVTVSYTMCMHLGGPRNLGNVCSPTMEHG